MPPIPSVNHTLAVSRLTALWALTEAGLGGLLHAFRTPFTGIFVGGIAVILIVLIGYFSNGKPKEILKALVIVLMVKVAVSPHSPPPAYLAVSFQAIMGALLFSFIRSPKIVGPLLGFLAMAESAGQKLLTLTLLFGESLWKALDTFISFTQDQMGIESTASGGAWVAWLYVGVYAAVGIVIGWWAGRMPGRISGLLNKWTVPVVNPENLKAKKAENSFWKTWWRRGRSALLIMVLILLAMWGLKDEETMDPIVLILRAMCVIVLWYGIIAPIIMEALKKYLSKKKESSETELAKVMDILPHIKGVSKIAWKETSHRKGIFRLSEFLSRMIVYSISLEIDPKEEDLVEL